MAGEGVPSDVQGAQLLRALGDERDVHRQVVRFARAMDERDWDTLDELLLPDATAELGAGLLEGSAAIIGLIRSFLDACGATQHLLGSVLVEVDGDVAVSRAYVSDVHLGTGERAHLTFSTLGDHHDRWEREEGAEGRWRLRHRTKVHRGQVGTMDVFRR